MKAVRVLLAVSAAFLLCASCTSRPVANRNRLEPSLQRVLESRPDSIVHVVLRLKRDARMGDEEQLRRLGLTIGSARGRIVTGSLRAADVLRLTSSPAVEWVELAGVLGVTRDE